MIDEDCLFCKIVAATVPATVVAETDRTVAFRDVNPAAPTHILIVPREHYANVTELAAADPAALAEMHTQAGRLAAEDGIAESGYRCVYNTGADAHQSVQHVHLHLLGGRDMSWPPG